jgi:hypothetical protein
MSFKYITLYLVVAACLWNGSVHGEQATRFVEDFSSTRYMDPSATSANWDTLSGTLYQRPFVSTILGWEDTPGAPHDLQVHGDLLYVADHTGGLRIFNMADPAALSFVSSFPTTAAWQVQVAGDLAYVADHSSGLRIIDVSNPFLPAQLGSYNTPGIAFGVVVAGLTAYVADDVRGVQVLDVGDPANPTLLGTCDTPGNAISLVLDGNHVFVADRGGGLTVVDVTDRANPTLVANFDTPGDAWGIDVQGDFAYLGAGTAGIFVFDISDPANPLQLGSVASGVGNRRIEVQGGFLYSASYSHFSIFNVNDPAFPTVEEVISLPGISTAVHRHGNLLFVASGAAGGIQTVKVADTNPPFNWGGLVEQETVSDIELVGEILFVAHYEPGGSSYLSAYDFSTPGLHYLISTYTMPSSHTLTDLAIDGNFAFVGSRMEGIRIIDISDPAAMTGVGWVSLNDVNGLAVLGDRVYAGNENYLYTIDVSNPASPQVLEQDPNGPSGRTIHAEGNRLTLVANDELQVFDIGGNGIPTNLGFVGGLGDVRNIEIAGDLIFVANGFLDVYEMLSPGFVAFLGRWEEPGEGSVVDLALSGDKLFITQGFEPGPQRRFKTLDVSSPGNPRVVHDRDIGASPTPWRLGNVVGDFVHDRNRSSGTIHMYQVFQRLYDAEAVRVQSLDIAGGPSTIVRAKIQASQGRYNDWSLSTGAGFEAVASLEDWHLFSSPGNELRWRVDLGWTDPDYLGYVATAEFEWLYDVPLITGIADVPNDQGRQVSLEWTRSGHDFEGAAQQITEYGVYRKIDPDSQNNASWVSRPSSKIGRLHSDLMKSADWYFVISVPARQENDYAVVVPTLADSTIAGGLEPSVFMVSALTATPGLFFDSIPDTGYSVDNLVPSIPPNLVLTGTELTWDPVPDPDFQYYTVYISTSEVLDSSAMVLTHTVDTSFEINALPHGHLHLTATDFSGNESPPATIAGVSDVPGAAPLEWALHVNAPNPFNPRTVIRFDVPESRPVTLAIYDMAGHRIRTLVDGDVLAPGYHEREWDGRHGSGQAAASGIYFYRLDSGPFSETRSMVLVK